MLGTGKVATWRWLPQCLCFSWCIALVSVVSWLLPLHFANPMTSRWLQLVQQHLALKQAKLHRGPALGVGSVAGA